VLRYVHGDPISHARTVTYSLDPGVRFEDS
jgi:hypothetical protein